MILEGIVTTVSAVGAVNVAPMGPRVDPDFSQIVLQPFRTSQTYQNLKARPEGVLHVTDDVLLLARAAVRALQPPPRSSLPRRSWATSWPTPAGTGSFASGRWTTGRNGRRLR